MRSCLAIAALALPAALYGQGSVDFNRDVRPILSDNCFACHGPDEQTRMADLRLDTREGAFSQRDGGPVIVPGDAAASRLYQRVSHEHPAARMPPPAFERSLTTEQIEAIRLWIEQGAVWESHWAFRKLERPEVPAAGGGWPRNPIDRFVLARLEAEGLSPSPEADKAALLRRLSFDLTGLPPTPAELDAFLADERPGAYERAVDRLLESPRYGERMAMRWLDLARYADTHGFHIDSHRDMWAWRDWVIGAYNANMPFDRFTVEQLAGDLLSAPSREQLVATGFNRNHMINYEGGAIPEEYHVEYVVDRVETTASVWMGLTMGCARCHDHKYDPISQRDFYRFFAFFNNIDEKGLDGQRGNAKPILQLPNAEQKAALAAIDRKIEKAKAALPEAELTALQYKWEDSALQTIPAPPGQGLAAHFAFESDLAGKPAAGTVERGEIEYGAARIGRGIKFDGEQHVTLGQTLDVSGKEPFSAAFWVRSTAFKGSTFFQKTDVGAARRGVEIFMEKSAKVPGEFKTAGRITVRLAHRWPGDAIEVRTQQPVTTREWHHITVTYDGSRKAAGVKFYADGVDLALDVLRDNLRGSIRNAAPFEIGAKTSSQPPFEGDLDELRVYRRLFDGPEIEALALHHRPRSLLEGDETKRPCDVEDEIRDYFRSHHAPEELREAHLEWKRLLAGRDRLRDEVPTAMIMSELASPRETFVLERGAYDAHGDPVEPGVPAWLPALPAGKRASRLDLARWIVSREHPLTARVVVNRDWENYFGTGFVKTSEDFGSQGEAPSHPGLLDWLAAEFIESGWDVKHIQRLIVTSATYRQSSRAAPELAERDPENRLLGRGPRFRLPAEMVRDNALAVSGLLHEKLGGPSVSPYQPKGLWEDVSYGDRFTAQTYEQGHGEDLYRRSMYTFWKRTSPPPGLVAFDAPDREKCTVRRARTNTPLQALVLLNDPTYVEAARVFAERMILEGGEDPDTRLRYGYKLALAREPDGAERDALLTLLHREREEFEANPAAARELVGVGEAARDPRISETELAAWTLTASAILNLDETMTKE